MTANRNSYLPSLDGWRCVAILGVLWAHDGGFDNLVGPKQAHLRLIGGFGVPLFYAISGYLIAYRILREEAKTGHFHIRDFYVRRLFRIQPAQWVFLAFVAVLMVLGAVHVTWRYWFGALFLYENYLWHNLQEAPRVVSQSLLVGHFWTLAVEEHFYLLVSLFFFLVRRRRTLVLGVLLLVLVALQHWGQHLGWYSQDVSSRRTQWQIQWLLFASWVALCVQSAKGEAWARKICRPWVVFLTTALLLYGHNAYTYGWHWPDVYDLVFANGETLAFCFTGWVVATVLHPTSWTTRMLEWGPIRFVGRISYSLYIWHVVFFLLWSPAVCSWPWLVHLSAPPWKYLCTLGTALLSYYGVEKPLIRLGHKLTPMKGGAAGKRPGSTLATA